MSSSRTSSTKDVTFREAHEWTPRLVPLGDVLPRLGLSRTLAYRLIARDAFPVPVVRVGKRWFVRITDLGDLLKPPT